MEDKIIISCGVRSNVVTIIRDLNRYLMDNNITLTTADEVRQLICIKGIGQWTINTTLLTAMLDWSIFPTGDIFVQERIKRLYGLTSRPSPKRVEEISEN